MQTFLWIRLSPPDLLRFPESFWRVLEPVRRKSDGWREEADESREDWSPDRKRFQDFRNQTSAVSMKVSVPNRRSSWRSCDFSISCDLLQKYKHQVSSALHPKLTFIFWELPLQCKTLPACLDEEFSALRWNGDDIVGSTAEMSDIGPPDGLIKSWREQHIRILW